MRKAMLLAAVLCILLAAPAAMAKGTITLTANFDKSSHQVEVRGTLASVKDPDIYFIFTPKDLPAPDADAINGNQAIILKTTAAADGSFQQVLYLPDDLVGGTWRMTATNGELREEFLFPYINTSMLTNLVEQVNKAPAPGHLIQVIEPVLSQLSIDQALFTQAKDFSGDILYARRPAGGFSGQGFLNTLFGSLAAYEIKYGASTPEEIFRLYLSDFLKYETDYLPLSGAAKTELWRLLKAADYKSADFLDLYLQNSLLARLRSASDFTEVRKVILENADALGISLTAYNKKTVYQQDLVMQAVYAKRDTIQTIKYIKTSFEDAINEVDSSSSGGQGGGPSGNRTNNNTTEVAFDPVAPSPSPSPQTAPFNDMEGHWANEVAAALSNRGILSGYTDGSFQPDNAVSRCEFAKMTAELFGLTKASASEFSDVSSTDWFAPYVLRCAAENIVQGSDGCFYPDRSVTREDAALMLYRALKNRSISLTKSAQFRDWDNISSYAREAVSALAGEGILNGYQGYFSPQDVTTRAEAAAMLYNLLPYLNEAQ